MNLIPAVKFLRRKRTDLVGGYERRGSVMIMSSFIGPARFNPARSLRTCPESFRHSDGLYRDLKTSLVFYPRPSRVCRSPRTFMDVSALSRALYKGAHPVRFGNIYAIIAGLFRVIMPSETCFKRGSTRRLTVVHGVIDSLGFSVRVMNYPVVHRRSKLTGSSEGACLDPRREGTTLYLSGTMGTKRRTVRTKVPTRRLLKGVQTIVRTRPLTGVSCMSVMSTLAVRPIRGTSHDILMTVTICVKGAELVSGFDCRMWYVKGILGGVKVVDDLTSECVKVVVVTFSYLTFF